MSYADLLRIYFHDHDPTAPSYSRQYRSAIWFHGDEQERQAREALARASLAHPGRVTTAIEPAGRFYLAEEYHQKFSLQQVPLLFADVSREKGWNDSTAAARLNGYLGGHGSKGQLAREIDSFGLSPKGRALISAMVASRREEEETGSRCR